MIASLGTTLVAVALFLETAPALAGADESMYTGGGIPRRLATVRDRKSGKPVIRVKTTVARSPTIFKILSLETGKPLTLKAGSDCILAIDGKPFPTTPEFIAAVNSRKAFQIEVRRRKGGSLPSSTHQKMLVITRLALEGANNGQDTSFKALLDARYDAAMKELMRLCIYQDEALLPIAKKFSSWREYALLSQAEQKQFRIDMEYVETRKNAIEATMTELLIHEIAYEVKNNAKLKTKREREETSGVKDMYLKHLTNLESRIQMIRAVEDFDRERKELLQQIVIFRSKLAEERRRRNEQFERDFQELISLVVETREQMQVAYDDLATQIAIQQAEVDAYNAWADEYNAAIDEQNAIAEAEYYEQAEYDGGWSQWDTSRLMFNQSYHYNPDHASVYGN
ncbi:MAG: hypothetical protein AAGA92_07990 [Planctomycetota bacterium]